MCLVLLVLLVTNPLAMPPQPAFDGLQPKSNDLQLTCLGFRVACGIQISTHVNERVCNYVCMLAPCIVPTTTFLASPPLPRCLASWAEHLHLAQKGDQANILRAHHLLSLYGNTEHNQKDPEPPTG